MLPFLIPPALVQVPPTPDAQREVQNLGTQLFEAMRTRDEGALRALFLPEGRLLSTFLKEGKPTLRVLTVDAFIRLVMETPEPFDERMASVEVRVDGEVATLWGPYAFRVGKRLTNCGINALHCVRTPEGWKIAEVLSTIRREGCEGPAESK